MSLLPAESALNVASIVMKNGGSTAMADRTFRNVLQGYGQQDVSAVWRLDIVAAFSDTEHGLSSILRPIGAVGVNLVRVSEAVVLGERVASGEISREAIASEIRRIETLPPPFGAWTMIAAAAITSGSFTRFASGDWGAFGIAFVAAGVGQWLRTRPAAQKLPATPLTLICATLSTCITAVGLRLGWSHTAPAAAIGSVMYMVPGLTLVNGFMDIISHKYLLMGLDRAVQAVYVFLILVIAIAFANAVIM
jgi:uncharacterized membrane protein YjjP (DUF1212 family)